MKLVNLKEVSEYEVYDWLKNEIELTEKQKEYLDLLHFTFPRSMKLKRLIHC